MGVVFIRASKNANEALPLLSRSHIFKKRHVNTTYTSSQSAVLVQLQICHFIGSPPSFSLSTLSRVTCDRYIVQRRNEHQIVAFYFATCLFIKKDVQTLVDEDIKQKCRAWA